MKLPRDGDGVKSTDLPGVLTGKKGFQMRAHKTETTVQSDGSILIKDLPFQAGEKIEVIILTQDRARSPDDSYALRGRTPYRFDEPLEPAVPTEEWEANR